MATKKYISLDRLADYDALIKAKIDEKINENKILVDNTLSSTSENPVQNKVIDAEFEAISAAMNALDSAIDDKADKAHNHDDTYYTKSEMDEALSVTKEKDLIVTYQSGSNFNVTHSSQEIAAAVNNGQTVKFKKGAELLNLLEADASYVTFYMVYVNMNNKLQQKIVVVSGNSVALEQDDVYDYATSSALNAKQDKLTGTNGQLVQFNASGKPVAVDPVFITVDDIDTICGGAIQYAEDVMF